MFSSDFTGNLQRPILLRDGKVAFSQRLNRSKLIVTFIKIIDTQTKELNSGDIQRWNIFDRLDFVSIYKKVLDARKNN